MNRIGAIALAVSLALLPLGGSALAQSSKGMSSPSRAERAASVDVKTLQNAKVQSDGNDVGKVNRVMVDPNTGRVSHVDITVTKGANRQVSVPWSDLKIEHDQNGNPVIALKSGALEASPAASPATGDHGSKKDQGNYKK